MSAKALVLFTLLLLVISSALADPVYYEPQIIINGAEDSQAFGQRTFIGDFNGDSKPDIIASESTYDIDQGGKLHVFFNPVDLESGEYTLPDFQADVVFLGQPENRINYYNNVCDFNGDGANDVALCVTNGSQECFVFYGGAQWTSGTVITDFANTADVTIIPGDESEIDFRVQLCQDLNGDGNSDLFGGRTPSVVLGDDFPSGTVIDLDVIEPALRFVQTGLEYADLFFGDMNADGHQDFILCDSNSFVKVWFGPEQYTTPQVIVREQDLYQQTTYLDPFGVSNIEDWDGDGADDMLTSSATFSTWPPTWYSHRNLYLSWPGIQPGEFPDKEFSVSSTYSLFMKDGDNDGLADIWATGEFFTRLFLDHEVFPDSGRWSVDKTEPQVVFRKSASKIVTGELDNHEFIDVVFHKSFVNSSNDGFLEIFLSGRPIGDDDDDDDDDFQCDEPWVQIILPGNANELKTLVELNDGSLLAGLSAPMYPEPTLMNSLDGGASWQDAGRVFWDHDSVDHLVLKSDNTLMAIRGAGSFTGNGDPPVWEYLSSIGRYEENGNPRVVDIIEMDNGSFLAMTHFNVEFYGGACQLYHYSETMDEWEPTGNLSWDQTIVDLLQLQNGTVLGIGIEEYDHIVWKSDDYALTWEQLSIVGSVGSPYSIEAMEDDSLYLGTTDGEIFLSTDQGESWVHKVTFPDDPHVLDFIASTDGAIYACLGAYGAFNEVVKSTDDGESWSQVLVPEYPDGSIAWRMMQTSDGIIYVLPYDSPIIYRTCPKCVIDDVEYDAGDPNPENVCLYCNPSNASDDWSHHDEASCDDGLFCNGDDSCSDGQCSIHAGNPCNPAIEECNEATDICDPLDDDDNDTGDDDNDTSGDGDDGTGDDDDSDTDEDDDDEKDDDGGC